MPYLLLFLLFQLNVDAQTDSLIISNNEYSLEAEFVKQHDPKKAALWSLIPGAGQIYNKKYWKLPIVYGLLGVSGYFIIENQREFTKYKDEAILRYNHGDTLNFTDLTNEEVLGYKELYENNRNLSILVFVGAYLLTIVDATVDAYFFEYDISPDVSFRAEPFIRPSDYHSAFPINAGLTLSLKL